MHLQKDIWDKEYKNNKNKWKKETSNLPNIFKGKNVLEIGVGNGKTLYSILRQKPKKVYAIDNSEEAVKICKSKFNEKNVFIDNMDAKSMNFKDENFDVVICYFTLNNMVKKDREKLVSEIYRVLIKKGKVLFEDFSVGDERQKGKKHTEKNTVVRKNGIICHFFEKKEINILFSKFKNKKLVVKKSNPLRSKSEVRRVLISAEFVK